MNRFLATALPLVAAAVLSTASAARATTVLEKSFSDLCNEADMIFVGKVVSVESHWKDEQKKSIITTVTFAVVEPVYGVTTSDVKLDFSGGDMDGLSQVVAGMPQFEPGEEVTIFASNEPIESPVTLPS